MKKILAAFLLMIYGFTSIGASVSIHQCSAEQETAHHYTNSSSSCSHQAAHLNADCCSTNVETSVAKTDDAVTEPVNFKAFNFQPAITGSFYPDEAVNPNTLVRTRERITPPPSGLHKIRLHLYNRILLI